MKKLNKFFAVLVALAMMAMLSVTAFAAPTVGNDNVVTGGTEESPVRGFLTKTLQMPEGTTTPDADFAFEWTQKTTGDGIQTATADETKLEDTLSFEGEAGTTADTVKKVVKSYEFTDVSAFTKAGRYQFDVEETKNNNTAIDSEPNETLTYSPDKYLVTIDVANGTTGLYIANVAVQKYNTDGSLGDKVNPTKPTDGEGSDFNFTNTYVKTLNTVPDGEDPDPEDPTDPTDPTNDNNGLFIQKTVVPYGNESLTDADKAVPFTFTVTVTKPSLSTKTTYKAKVVDTTARNTAAAVNVDTTATKDADNYELTFTSGTPATVTLKHGQRLVFEDLDVGATYTVAETADSGYVTTIGKTANGQASAFAEKLAESGTISEGKDYAHYKNTRAASNTPTGILISNLPYIALALVAIGGLVAYVVVRRKDEDNA